VRHVLCAPGTTAITGATRGTALSPAPRSLGVGDAPSARVLVAGGGLTASGVAGLSPANPSAVAVATVAAAAQNDLHATPRAQVQAGWSIHKHPG
jgi:hypothetical protein